MPELPSIQWDSQGLIPAIIQDARSRQVLMLGWMNTESLTLTLETGFVHFWSRSRQELWKKGATSGNVLKLDRIDIDCDADALLVRAHPAGPTCHTGQITCFYESLHMGSPTAEALPDMAEPFISRLFATIQDRKINPRPDSYTNQLLDAGEEEILKKIGEESIEVILAAARQSEERLLSELADLVYHGLVLLAARDLTPEAVSAVLEARHNS